MKTDDEQWRELIDRLNAIRMSESDRQLAMASLRSAERFCEWYGRIAETCGAIGFALKAPLRRWLSSSR